MAKVRIKVSLSETSEIIDLVDYGYCESAKWVDLLPIEKEYITNLIKIKNTPKFNFEDIE